MGEQEEIYNGFSDLDPMINDKDDLVNPPKPSYNHLKHTMRKVKVGSRGEDQTLEIIVGEADSVTVLKFIQDLELSCQKEVKKKEDERM